MSCVVSPHTLHCSEPPYSIVPPAHRLVTILIAASHWLHVLPSAHTTVYAARAAHGHVNNSKHVLTNRG